jgi:hypothetical protein
MTDAVLVSERDHTPAQFEAMVQAARAAGIETFAEDTLAEAIALELERNHGFTYISDEKLRASMSVGMGEEDTYLVEQSGEFRSIVAEMERS